VGGPVYLGDEYPAGYRGAIFYGDFFGTLRRLVANGSGGPISAPFAHDWSGVDLTSAPGGNLVYVDFSDGSVKQIVYTRGNAEPQPFASASPNHGAAPLTVELDASGSTDPDEDPLTYRWTFGDGSPSGEGAKVSHRYVVPGSYPATLTVDDGRGKASTATVRIRVTAAPPRVSCVVPKVVGKTLAGARRAIVKANCTTGRIETAYSQSKRGRVVSQAPRAGRRLKKGSRVNLLVSKGRKPVFRLTITDGHRRLSR
jgi:PKD repeat protein